MDTQTQERLVTATVDCLDCNRIVRSMKAINWKWALLQRTPSRGEVSAKARELLGETIRQSIRTGTHAVRATGGLKATAEIFAGAALSKSWARVEFVLTSWTTCVDELPSLDPITALRDYLAQHSTPVDFPGGMRHCEIPVRLQGEPTAPLMYDLYKEGHITSFARFTPDPSEDAIAFSYTPAP